LANDRFAFYNITFLEREYIGGNIPSSSNEHIHINTKFYGIRSVIEFGTEIFSLEDGDFELMRYWASAFSAGDFTHLYSKKVRVYSGNRSFWLYLQTGLEQYISGQKATIRYYPIEKNRELFLIGIGFFSIQDLNSSSKCNMNPVR
jgi:hypothetical protein